MFQKLYEFSAILPKNEKWECLNEGMPEIYDKGLAVCFDKAGSFASVEILDGNEGVVYRAGPSNGTDYTPCCKLAKTTDKRLLKAVKKLAESADVLEEPELEWLAHTIKSFENDQTRIWDIVKQQEQNSGIDGKTHRGYVFWAKKTGGKIYPVYEWESCKDAMIKAALLNWKEKGGMNNEGTCCVCGNQKIPVFGNFSLLACYNLDKIGSIAGGFKERNGFKNFPVCEECAFEIGRTVILVQNNLTSQMAGQTYMILPYANSDDARIGLFEILKNNPHRFSLGKQKDLTAEEWRILEEIKDDDQIAFCLIFFKQDNASWRIQAEVQHVLPSRIKAIYEAFKHIRDASDLLTEKQDEEKPILVNALLIRNFSEAGDKKSEETFRSWLVALFDHKQIDYKHFLHHLVKRIITVGKRNESLLPWTLRQAWGFYRYARITGLIEPKNKGETMEDIIPESAYGKYLLEHKDFFDRPEKVVAFLTGCYASVVTGVQKQKRNSTPFSKKFVGRLVSEDHLRRLYREGHDKLSQYEALGIVAQTLDPDLASAWVLCGNEWKITDEESTFAFTIGYSLAYRIRKMYGEIITKNTDSEGGKII